MEHEQTHHVQIGNDKESSLSDSKTHSAEQSKPASTKSSTALFADKEKQNISSRATQAPAPSY
jgi:hypothetical protein